MTSRTPVRGVPLSHQVREILFQRIKDGFYPPETQLPPEHNLAAEFKVSRATVRSAISALAARGLIVRRHGIGNFVSKLSRLSHPLNEAMDFEALITGNGFEYDVEFVSAAFEEVDERAADALQIEPASQVLRAEKIFFADGEPVIYCVNTIPVWIFSDGLQKEIEEDPEITEPLFDFLEIRCGQRVDYHIASIQASTVEVCDFPGIPQEPNTPVLVIEEVGYNADERPVWHSYEFYPGNQMSFELIRYRDSRR
jgi:GntR family transcriptional regulator